MSDGALNKHLDWLDRCAEEQANEPDIPREDLIHYLTTMLLWHELDKAVKQLEGEVAKEE